MILVTGFKPFLGETLNPSEVLLAKLKSLKQVETLLLPVEFDGAFNNLKIHLQQKFKFILMLGQAGGSANIRMERVALNLEDGMTPDAVGTVRIGHLIEISGPPAIFSPLPLNQWRQHLTELLTAGGLGHRIELSNHAGTYVCNSLYFKTLRHSLTPALFVHLPYIREQVLSKAPGTPFMDLGEQWEVVQNLIGILQN